MILITIENFSKNFIPAQKKRLEGFSAYSQNFGSFEAEFLIKMFLIKKRCIVLHWAWQNYVQNRLLNFIGLNPKSRFRSRPVTSRYHQNIICYGSTAKIPTFSWSMQTSVSTVETWLRVFYRYTSSWYFVKNCCFNITALINEEIVHIWVKLWNMFFCKYTSI